MRFNKFLTLGLIFSAFAGSAQAVSVLDSLRTEKRDGKSFIVHQVEAKETLFAISRRYQTPVGEIVKSNESLKSGLKAGQEIFVPFIGEEWVPAGSDLHKVASGETLYSISKKYNVSIGELKTWNSLRGNDLSVGQALIIKGQAETPKPIVAEVEKQEIPQQTQPTSEKAVATNTEVVKVEEKAPKKVEKVEAKAEKAVEEKSSVAETPKAPAEAVALVPGDWISHEVRSGETLFSISKQYNAKVEEVIRWNGLSSNNLKVGQVIKVGRAEPAPSQVPIVGEPKVVTDVEEMHEVPDGASSGGFKNISEMGQAEVIPGTGGHKKYLVLHRTAPVGTIMRVKNEENDITIFARVVGVLPETGDNSKLVIKLSQAAYDQLKAVNPRFPVEVAY
ncbi:LysM peptidoglycan-binding domain-containing protein [Algoriphagus marincola]|uniref:LysM peptidoglycan-binding domain-containing protein n=1 Tax=Algoriphagus marincola TaxID=264027 RepID=A0ABS7N2A9_9BACT|nr:LysM peptidoglycan-binding domain-containing protein [Algoriphagus marincola]MBY5950439.1 LysM peptidoglycan-binding domain-containing protein [Algoriphagus marincola]